MSLRNSSFSARDYSVWFICSMTLPYLSMIYCSYSAILCSIYSVSNLITLSNLSFYFCTNLSRLASIILTTFLPRLTEEYLSLMSSFTYFSKVFRTTLVSLTECYRFKILWFLFFTWIIAHSSQIAIFSSTQIWVASWSEPSSFALGGWKGHGLIEMS
jgi:hypothetical protein